MSKLSSSHATPHSHPLDILYLTNFSDYCFRSIPAIAQIADSMKVRLTIMHVYDPNRMSKADAENRTSSFFPEADRYPACHRVTVPGPVEQAVARHLEFWPINLIVAPASDVIGIPHFGQSSIRSELVKSAGVPLWTIGRKVDLSNLIRPVRNVACWLDYYSDQTNHLQFAAEYARVNHAKLHLLRSLPSPSEGLLTHPDEASKSLHPKLAARELQELFDTLPCTPEILVETGQGASMLKQMLRECRADIAFFGEEQSFFADWLGLGLRWADAAPCPAIYVGNYISVPVWSLEEGMAHHAVAARVSSGKLTPEAHRIPVG